MNQLIIAGVIFGYLLVVVLLIWWAARKSKKATRERLIKETENSKFNEGLKVGDRVQYYGLVYAKVVEIDKEGDLGLKPLHYIKRGKWITPIPEVCKYHADFEKI